jgi:hypothetical protein
MAVNLMNKVSDGRRAKNHARKRHQMPLLEQLTLEMKQRPQALFDKGTVVKIPIGYRRVETRYHSNTSGWHYQIVVKIEYTNRPRPEYRTFRETEIKPTDFYIGQVIKLSCGLEKAISEIGLSPKNDLLIGFEIRPKYYSWYSEEKIYQHNPQLITPEYALQQLYNAYVREIGNKSQVVQVCLNALPELANI